jgi:oligopeptide/dipeptide ABC transporter ATP-binding protein
MTTPPLTDDRSGAALLEVEDLTVRFRANSGTVHAVNGVSLTLAPGGTLGLVGESGCGKTVTSLAIARLLPPTARVERGLVRLQGADLLRLPEAGMRRIRGAEIAMVFQDPTSSLNPVLPIGEQITETLRAHARLPRSAARARAADLLDQVGIPDPRAALARYPHELSGGMRQRVMIAIALALQPKLLIADEPTTALDVTIQAQVLDLIKRLTSELGTAVMLISHNLGVVADMTQRVAIMYAGYVVEEAATVDVFARPRHPYTVGLLHSLPRPNAPELVPIEGAPPDLRSPPRGCPFAPRCAWRLDACLTEMPPLRPLEGPGRAGGGVAPQHQVACHNPVRSDEVAAGRPRGPSPARTPSTRPAPESEAAHD